MGFLLQGLERQIDVHACAMIDLALNGENAPPRLSTRSQHAGQAQMLLPIDGSVDVKAWALIRDFESGSGLPQPGR